MRVIAHDKSGKVSELETFKKTVHRLLLVSTIFCSEELFYAHCLGSCPEAVTLIGIMEMYSEGNKTRILIEV